MLFFTKHYFKNIVDIFTLFIYHLLEFYIFCSHYTIYYLFTIFLFSVHAYYSIFHLFVRSCVVDFGHNQKKWSSKILIYNDKIKKTTYLRSKSIQKVFWTDFTSDLIVLFKRCKMKKNDKFHGKSVKSAQVGPSTHDIWLKWWVSIFEKQNREREKNPKVPILNL